MMEFTYSAYESIIDLLRENKYEFADYHKYELYDKCVVLRHDVDYDLKKTIQMAELENKNGVSATYFVLATSGFYNVMSRESKKVISYLQSLGHKIGLHFDEANYDITEETWCPKKINELIKQELTVLNSVMEKETCMSISMHRPSKQTLESNLYIEGIANAYSKEYFRNFKYLSDSRMNWREDPIQVIQSKKHNRIQLLTHPFWYFDEPKDMKNIIYDFLYGKENAEYRYKTFSENFSRLGDVLTIEEAREK